MKMSEIKKMSVAQRLQAMESLWDSFLYEGIEVDSPPWHGEVLAQRKAKIDNGQARFLTIEQLRKAR